MDAVMKEDPNIERIKKAANRMKGESKVVRKILDPDGIMEHGK